jgi:hypothetical protein
MGRLMIVLMTLAILTVGGFLLVSLFSFFYRSYYLIEIQLKDGRIAKYCSNFIEIDDGVVEIFFPSGEKLIFKDFRCLKYKEVENCNDTVN